jgi:hypothetical protein
VEPKKSLKTEGKWKLSVFGVCEEKCDEKKIFVKKNSATPKKAKVLRPSRTPFKTHFGGFFRVFRPPPFSTTPLILDPKSFEHEIPDRSSPQKKVFPEKNFQKKILKKKF